MKFIPYHLKPILSSILLLSFIILTPADGNNEPNDLKTDEILSSLKKSSFIGCDMQGFSLGIGYSSDFTVPTQTCINFGNPPYAYSGSAEGMLETFRYYEVDAVRKQLSVGGEVGINLDFFSLGLASDFLRNIEDDKYSETFIYRTAIKLKNTVYKPPEDGDILNDIGKKHLNNPDIFHYVCGDQYVAEMGWGGYLYVAVKFTFHSAQDERVFKASMSGSIANIFKMNAHFSDAISETNKNGEISIHAYQLGGDPTKLGKIITGKTGRDLAPILYCSFDNLDKCREVLNAVIDYAASPTDHNFPTQITDDGSSLKPISAASTRVVFRDYYSLLGEYLPHDSKVTHEIKEWRNKLASRLIELRKHERRVKFLMRKFSEVTDYIESLQKILIFFKSYEAKLMEAGRVCFLDMDQCVNAGKKYIGRESEYFDQRYFDLVELLTWRIVYEGVMVDTRLLLPNIQADLCKKGLIPYSYNDYGKEREKYARLRTPKRCEKNCLCER